MDEKIKKAIVNKVAAEPFAQKFSIKLIDIQAGYAKVEMRFTEDMENIFGMAQGGALFALIDEAFEIASNSHGLMAVALNMSISYISSPAKGSLLRAEAKELSKTDKTATYEIRVTDNNNGLIAACQALVYRKNQPLPFL
jgi:acyl-CoA thioesterase